MGFVIICFLPSLKTKQKANKLKNQKQKTKKIKLQINLYFTNNI